MKSIFTLALAALLGSAAAIAEDAQRPKNGGQAARPPPGGPGGKNAQRPPTGRGGGPQQGGGGGGAKGNPFAAGKMYANNFYAGEVAKALEQLSDPSLRSKAAKAATIPSFFWLDTASKVPEIANFVADVKKKGGSWVIPLVVYDLPNRDCAAYASNGEYQVSDPNHVQQYQAYISAIKSQIQKAGNSTKFVLIYEPDSLANLITNMNVQKCQQAQSVYRSLTTYGLKALSLPNVAIYLDAGHAGWLGWKDNMPKAIQLFNEVYQQAGGARSSVRGLATNVANYNAWEGACPGFLKQNEVGALEGRCSEKTYIAGLRKGLSWAHFVVDTSRNGVQPTAQKEWGNWCNVIGTGFGVRPTANTGADSSYLDAFVWIKPGGECDGTSEKSAPRYDVHCSSPDALQPSPQAGAWFQAYFEQLVKNANPPL